MLPDYQQLCSQIERVKTAPPTLKETAVKSYSDNVYTVLHIKCEGTGQFRVERINEIIQ